MTTRSARRTWRRNLWTTWLAVTFFLPYTPLMSPLHSPGHLFGLPSQPVIWLAWTLVLGISLVLFFRFEWLPLRGLGGQGHE